MKTQHTPAPWSVGPWFDNFGEPELIIEHKSDAGNLVIAVALGGLVGQEANANLISAAPDLLEFAQWILTLKMGGLIDARAIDVINKATGKA